ncbi:unnamed protein product [Phytomonas sp. Hart1]|nr:unnamed protein product [Phytomonas sp. Hart1]|eukprot:CCW69432.1 unnamed protein product [Phytomonas sp. isolate Hart1]
MLSQTLFRCLSSRSLSLCLGLSVSLFHFPPSPVRVSQRFFTKDPLPGSLEDTLREALAHTSSWTEDFEGVSPSSPKPPPGSSEGAVGGGTDGATRTEKAPKGVNDKGEKGANPERNAKDDKENGDETLASVRRRRQKRRFRSVDTILGDIVNEAIHLRDKGEKPNTDFIYKRTQERIYEAEYGRKPSGAKECASKYLPFPPDPHLRRIFPMYDEEVEIKGGSKMGGLGLRNFLPEDPWPERAITTANPVWSRRMVEIDDRENDGKGLKEWEDRLFNPREGFDLLGEFTDAVDELRHWMCELISFLREVPITQRRTLPFLHEWHRFLVHRLVRAERRYGQVRDAALAHSKASTALYKRTEELLDYVREIYIEAHRSLSSPNYDPFRMKKSVIASFMKMNNSEFEEWKEEQTRQHNIMIADLS